MSRLDLQQDVYMNRLNKELIFSTAYAKESAEFEVTVEKKNGEPVLR